MDDFIKQVTRQAGKFIAQQYGHVGVAYTKRNVADVVTEADVASNRMLADAIRKKFPAHGIVSEEQPEWQTDAEYLWIIDPLDGTRNFASGVPLFGVMVALARDGVLESAAIHDPISDRLYFARRGQGATCNGKPIRCSTRTEWGYSYGCGGASLGAGKADIMGRLIRSAVDAPFWMNLLGSCAVCAMCVAEGRRDWWVSLSGGVWDYAAGALLLQEAGCTVTNLKGAPWTIADREMAVAPPALHAELLRRIEVGGPSR